MKVTLLFDNVPIETDDIGGMWLGVGFGSDSMLGADLVICEWSS